jgi:hypothetical protein
MANHTEITANAMPFSLGGFSKFGCTPNGGAMAVSPLGWRSTFLFQVIGIARKYLTVKKKIETQEHQKSGDKYGTMMTTRNETMEWVSICLATRETWTLRGRGDCMIPPAWGIQVKDRLATSIFTARAIRNQLVN